TRVSRDWSSDVCSSDLGGAGADLLPNAIAANADVFLTADLKYHQFFDALDIDGHPTIALVDAGHYETEVVTEELLREELSMRFRSEERPAGNEGRSRGS